MANNKPPTSILPSIPSTIQPIAPSDPPRSLQVFPLDHHVSDHLLRESFAKFGHLVSCRIIPNKPYGGASYGFVEYADHKSAESAAFNMNGKKLSEGGPIIRVALVHPEDMLISEHGNPSSSNAHQLFIGDLSSEVNDQMLAAAFKAEARVMWDMNTGKSRGYGFVSYKDRSEAEDALKHMNGQWVGNRPVRVNWANQKASSPTRSVSSPTFFEDALVQAPFHNTTVYIGNLPFFTTQEQITPLFEQFGMILEIRMQSDRGFAFVRMDSHNAAAMAIVKLNGMSMNGRQLRCAWGKDRAIDQPQVMWANPLMSSPPIPSATPFQYPSMSQGGIGYLPSGGMEYPLSPPTAMMTTTATTMDSGNYHPNGIMSASPPPMFAPLNPGSASPPQMFSPGSPVMYEQAFLGNGMPSMYGQLMPNAFIPPNHSGQFLPGSNGMMAAYSGHSINSLLQTASGPMNPQVNNYMMTQQNLGGNAAYSGGMLPGMMYGGASMGGGGNMTTNGGHHYLSQNQQQHQHNQMVTNHQNGENINDA